MFYDFVNNGVIGFGFVVYGDVERRFKCFAKVIRVAFFVMEYCFESCVEIVLLLMIYCDCKWG